LSMLPSNNHAMPCHATSTNRDEFYVCAPMGTKDGVSITVTLSKDAFPKGYEPVKDLGPLTFKIEVTRCSLTFVHKALETKLEAQAAVMHKV
jgi:hypothetical protein